MKNLPGSPAAAPTSSPLPFPLLMSASYVRFLSVAAILTLFRLASFISWLSWKPSHVHQFNLIPVFLPFALFLSLPFSLSLPLFPFLLRLPLPPCSPSSVSRP